MNTQRARTGLRTGIALTLALAAGLYGSPATADRTTVASGAASAATEADATARKVRVGVAYDVGGRGDKGLNDSVATGIDRAVRKLRLGAVKEVRAGRNDDSDEKRAKLLRSLASRGYNPVIAVGWAYSLAVREAAAEYPRTHFAIVDDATSTGENITNLTFAENEAAFLAGVAAALKSSAHHVGFVGGVKTPLIQKYQAGFQAGAKAVDPHIKVDSRYITAPPDFGGFNYPEMGKAKALALYGKGADVVFHAAEASGAGVFAAAKEAGGLAIGCDIDQALSADPAVGDVILTSALKRADVAVYDFVKRFAAKKAKPGVKVYGAKAGGIDYATTGGKVDDIKAQLDAYKRKIATGRVKVPTRPS